MNFDIASMPMDVLLVVGLVVVFGVFFISGGDAAEKRLRERVSAVREISSKRTDPTEATLLDDAIRHRKLLQILSALGYRPDLPPQYRPNLKIVFAISTGLLLGTFKLAQAALPFIPAAILAGFVFSVATLMQFKRKRASYRTALFKQIPDTMSLILRAVRAGLPVAEAIRSVSRESLSPTKDEFGRVAAETALGAPVELTLRRLYDRTGIQEFAFFAVVIGLHGQTGGNLAETLDNLADTVRRRVAMAAKARALSAEGRLSAIVVGGLPFVVGLAVLVMNPDYMDEFWTTSQGHTLVLAFAVLLTMGMAATHWLVKQSTRD